MRNSFDHFMRNAWEPIAVPRWALTLKYSLFTAVGLLAFFTGVPSLVLTTPQGYETIWSGIVSLAAAVGLFGSIRPKWALWEALGGVLLVIFLAVLVVSFWFRHSYATGGLLLIVTVLPAVRSAYLITRASMIHRGTF